MRVPPGCHFRVWMRRTVIASLPGNSVTGYTRDRTDNCRLLYSDRGHEKR